MGVIIDNFGADFVEPGVVTPVALGVNSLNRAASFTNVRRMCSCTVPAMAQGVDSTNFLTAASKFPPESNSYAYLILSAFPCQSQSKSE